MSTHHQLRLNRQIAKSISLGLILLTITLLTPTFTTKEAPMNDVMLTCELEALSTFGGEIALSFHLRNPSDHPINIRYFKPFVGFDLSVYADDGQISIVQPAYDTGLQPISITLAAGETTQIDTPIRLRFDPNVKTSGGDVPTLWTLRHLPVPVLLRAIVQLSGATVTPCEVRFSPKNQN
jgi:hypothetical protein